MAKVQRSSKWTFLIYKESAPDNYKEVLEELKVPFMLSPWHDKDTDKKTGKTLKAHKHGALFFDSLKSYQQVSDLISENLNGPKHVEAIMSPTGIYDYFTHAQNKDKTKYDVNDIEFGCGFNLEKFQAEVGINESLNKVIDLIEENKTVEFSDIVLLTRNQYPELFKQLVKYSFFFSKYIDSRRYNRGDEKESDDENANEETDDEKEDE